METGTRVQLGYVAEPEFGTLQLPLITRVKGSELAGLVHSLVSLYRICVEMDQRTTGTYGANDVAARGGRTRVLPDLEITALEIGTPNFGRFFGRRGPLVKITALVGTVLGLTLTGVEVYTRNLEGERVKIEIREMAMKTAHEQLQIILETKQAVADHKLTEEQCQHYLGQAAEALAEFKSACHVIAKDHPEEIRFEPYTGGHAQF
ncbi:MAG TPA: hypothetical protein VGJ18_18630 [Gemmatimonadaceae bacterium]|jgi:hypothetical protein